MAIRNIVFSDNEFIRKQSKTVTQFNESLWELLDDMKETMHKNNGCGLAAIQVGVLKRVVIVEVNNLFLELINPEIIETYGEQCEVEGCLSVKNVSGYVKRPEQVTVKACDRYGNEFVITGTGFLACALCHEIDHTYGVLFIDKMESEYKPKSNKKGNN